MADIREIDGRREMWLDLGDYGAGWVCAEPEPVPTGGQVLCAMPVESTPCSIHYPGLADQP